MVGASGIAQEAASSYRISLRRAGDGVDAIWHAEVENRPECSAEGTSPEEALQRAWAAANGTPAEVEVGRETGRTAPARHSGRILVRMPASLHDELAKTAESEGVSLNQLITSALASAVGWRGQTRKVELRGAAGVTDSDSAPLAAQARWSQPRVTRMVLVANIALVLIAAIAAIALLLLAWNGA